MISRELKLLELILSKFFSIINI